MTEAAHLDRDSASAGQPSVDDAEPLAKRQRVEHGKVHGVTCTLPSQMSTFAHPVLTKLSAVLECAHRPLMDGERPKRKGQDTVFEATGKTSPAVDLAALRAARATVKHDGSCCYVTDNGVLCARRDIRKATQAPAEAVQISDDVCFIPLPFEQPVPAEYKFHHAALASPEQAHSLDSGGKPILITLKHGMTYELVGPKVQSNPYRCPVDDMVQIQTTKKAETVPKHYLIEHGAFEVPTFRIDSLIADPLNYAREFIIGSGIEGIVFHCPGGDIYKINRGHIGVEIDGGLNVAVCARMS